MAVTDSYLIAARMPLFEHLLAGGIHLFGNDILTLRLLTALCGTITVGLVYTTISTASNDNWLALCGALSLAIYPKAMIYSRFGFSYNLIPPLLLCALWFYFRHHRANHNRWLYAACLMMGLTGLVDLVGLALIGAWCVFIIVAERTQWKALFFCLMPLAFYVLARISTNAEIFLHDLSYTLGRTNALLSEQIQTLANNYLVLLHTDIWIVGSLIGLFLLPASPLRLPLLSLLFLPLIVIGRSLALYSLSTHYMIAFFPFVAIGVGCLLRYGVPHTTQVIQQALVSIPLPTFHQPFAFLAALILIGSPVAWTIHTNLQSVQTHIHTEIDTFLVPAREGRQLQAWLTTTLQTEDYVIASPTFAWMIDAPVADYQMAAIAGGDDGIFFPNSLYPERFAFDARYENATYAIVDSIWRNWATVHIPAADDMLNDITSTWLLVFETAQLQVYQNPSRLN